MIIGIDSGHGGRDPGAVGPGGTREAHINLAVGLELACLLETPDPEGQQVATVMTRSTDVYLSLSDREIFLNRHRCSLIVSLHVNAFHRPEPNYLSAFICARGGRAEQTAARLLPPLAAATGWPDGGVRVAPFYILRRTWAPAVLLELGFISNPEQEQMLRNPAWQAKLAGVIAEVIRF